MVEDWEAFGKLDNWNIDTSEINIEIKNMNILYYLMMEGKAFE